MFQYYYWAFSTRFYAVELFFAGIMNNIIFSTSS